MSVGLAPHFVWDAVAALIALLPVPRVPGKFATGLLLVQLQEGKNYKEKDWMILCGIFGNINLVQVDTMYSWPHTGTSCMYSAWMLISVEAYSDRTILVNWPSHALLPELTVRASVLQTRE